MSEPQHFIDKTFYTGFNASQRQIDNYVKFRGGIGSHLSVCPQLREPAGVLRLGHLQARWVVIESKSSRVKQHLQIKYSSAAYTSNGWFQREQRLGSHALALTVSKRIYCITCDAQIEGRINAAPRR